MVSSDEEEVVEEKASDEKQGGEEWVFAVDVRTDYWLNFHILSNFTR